MRRSIFSLVLFYAIDKNLNEQKSRTRREYTKRRIYEIFIKTIERWHLMLFRLLCMREWIRKIASLSINWKHIIIIRLDANWSEKIARWIKIEIKIKMNDRLNGHIYWCENYSYLHLNYEVAKESTVESRVYVCAKYRSNTVHRSNSISKYEIFFRPHRSQDFNSIVWIPCVVPNVFPKIEVATEKKTKHGEMKETTTDAQWYEAWRLRQAFDATTTATKLPRILFLNVRRFYYFYCIIAIGFMGFVRYCACGTLEFQIQSHFQVHLHRHHHQQHYHSVVQPISNAKVSFKRWSCIASYCTYWIAHVKRAEIRRFIPVLYFNNFRS